MYHQTQEQYEEKLTSGTITGSKELKKNSDGTGTGYFEKLITVAMVMDP